ncbi:2'-deoxycytidine 5'-triphosphate deaminase [Candidatus Pacearchaeota archaeon]|nr:2'-deoxycytidine 5'-triphosphate deaminase [Candidatus Pacearchaeota archaeon]
MDEDRGYSLVSQQIRSKILNGEILNVGTNLGRVDEGPRKGWFKDEGLEGRIQPASIDPIVGNEIYVLDTETQGLLSPDTEEIYRTLLRIPKRQRQKFDITNGYEIKNRYTYLLPLEEKVILHQGEVMKSSPKSTSGRLFFNARMFTDYNPTMDEAHAHPNSNTALRLWLLLQPLSFNAIVYPGLSFNQLRFFQGYDSQLSTGELISEFKKDPFINYRNADKQFTAPESCPLLADGGLRVNLDLHGEATEGVVGLRTRNNPIPIDLKKIKHYNAEDYFEPLVAKPDTPFVMRNGDHALFASQGVLRVPAHLSAEVESFSNVGIMGPLDLAGFIDPGFRGDLVFEIRSDEVTNMRLRDGKPLTSIKFYRTNETPDKVYGGEIGSNYQGQIGPKTAKQFKEFDFTAAAKNYRKLDRIVLVEDLDKLRKFRRNEGSEGFEPIDSRAQERLLNMLNNESFWQSRYDCEDDESLLQPIPYVLLFGPDESVFSYVRAKNIKDYGDSRLFGKHSIGVGGHVNKTDKHPYIRSSMMRELDEEVEIDGPLSEPKLVGTLLARNTAVDRVHFGLIYTAHTEGAIKRKDLALESGRLMKISEIEDDPLHQKKYETWSNIMIPHLSMLYKH